MHRTCQSRRRTVQRNSGLTLIELLIVVTIFLLLTTFTVVAVDFTFESERVGAAARQTQSLLEGARDRSIRAREPRGVRLILDSDPDNGRMVSSLIYVGAAEPWTEGAIQLQREDASPADGVADAEDVLIVVGSLDTLWNKLSQRGFLGVPGQETPRIKIPGDKNGTWYRVQTHLLGVNPLIPNVLRLVHPYRDPGTTEITEVVAFDGGSGPLTYELELPPRVLPDADPVLLPDGVVIDLDASDVPTAWRPSAGSSLSAPYSNRMDLMFSPRGTLIGTTAGTGLIHLYVSLREDVQKSTDAGRLPVNAGDNPSVPTDTLFASLAVSGAGQMVVGDRGLVTIFSSTGKVSSHPINLDNFDPDPNSLDDPFLFAELGEVKN
jgi:prepilin-type N-terminal cleavage/methylation domain-containing protein